MSAPHEAVPGTGDRAALGMLWVAVERYGQQGITFVAFVVLSRILTPEAFGLFAMGLVFTALVEELIDLGIGPALVQRAVLDDEHIDTALIANVGVGAACAAVGWLAAGLIALLFRQPALAPVVRWLSLAFVLEGWTVTQEALLRRQLLFRALAMRTIAATLVGGIVAVVAAMRGAGLWSLVAFQLTRRAVEVIVLWSVGTWRPRLRFSQRHLLEILGFGRYMLGTRLLTWASQRSDDLIVGVFLGPRELGFYTMGYRAFNLLSVLVTGVMTTVIFPALSSLQAERARLVRAFSSAARLNALVVFPVYAAVAIFGGDVVRLLLGAQWAPAGTVLRILALVGAGMAAGALNGAALMALGRADWLFRLNVLTTAVNVAAFAVAVRWGINAVAGAFVVRTYVLSPLGFIVLRRVSEVSLRRHFGQFIGPAIATTVAAVAAWAATVTIPPGEWQPLLRSALGLSTGTLVYALVIYLVAPALAREVVGRLMRLVPGAAPN